MKVRLAFNKTHFCDRVKKYPANRKNQAKCYQNVQKNTTQTKKQLKCNAILTL